MNKLFIICIELIYIMILYVYSRTKLSGNLIFAVIIDHLHFAPPYSAPGLASFVENIKKEVFEKVHRPIDDPEYDHVYWQRCKSISGDVAFKCDIRKTSSYFRRTFDYFCAKFCKWNVSIY
jgi:hypothetical protein